MKKIYENKKLILIIGGIVLLILSLIIYLDNDNKKIEDDIVLNITTEKLTLNNKEKESFYVDIKGNVKNPGVYEVIKGEVINDIIEKAGGLKKNSYVKNINLSKKVNDEMVINILSIDEFEDLMYVCPVCVCEEVKCEEVTTTKNVETSTIKTTILKENFTTVLSSETTTKEITTSLTSATTSKIVDLININTSVLEELMTISGIGESKAKAIIAYREEKGNFKTIEDIKNVKGIGEKLFESIKEFITV